MSDDLRPFNIVVKDGAPKAIELDETLSYYNNGWAVVKSVESTGLVEAISSYFFSFNENHEDDHLFCHVSDDVKAVCNAENKLSSSSGKSSVLSSISSVLAVKAATDLAEPHDFFTDDGILEFDNDALDCSLLEINPATGFPMSGGIDVAGNSLGCSDSLSSTEL